jgi:hypothetical protein
MQSLHGGKWAKKSQPRRREFPPMFRGKVPIEFEPFYTKEDGRTLSADPLHQRDLHG